MLNLNDIGEFGFINRISRGCLIRPNAVIKGIGDDAAVFAAENGRVFLLTTDLLIERIHFLRNATSGFGLGYKALAVNLSDIAAMGGKPNDAFISIGIPKDCSLEYLDDLYEGMKTLASEFQVNILGGDTTSSKSDLIINIAMTGTALESEILYRHTARNGDVIAVTGCIGESRAGLHLILENKTDDSKEFQTLVDAHLFPKPYVLEGRFLAGLGCVHAAIDVSDGLSSDLRHILEASTAGARLYSSRIPVSGTLNRFCERFGFDLLEFALAGGEDYVLICTLSSDMAEKACSAYFETFKKPLHIIGEITSSGTMEIVGPCGETTPLAPTGWDHFKT
ncbi:MAG: thiamine-phosphate kinase [Thermodesulfobacteriota bacterium]